MRLTINTVETAIPPDYATEPLLWLLRDGLGLTGTHYGCGVGQCGSCMVLVNGIPTKTCQTSVEAVEDAEVLTIEGLEGAALHPVQQAFVEFPLQCMWCLPGHVMAAVALLAKNPDADAEDIEQCIEENLCRCGGYNQIKRAIARALELQREHESHWEQG
jgi:aerobic-type carbon monoxide dehydrogenase small subunit (CoxS/CutS family)